MNIIEGIKEASRKIKDGMVVFIEIDTFNEVKDIIKELEISGYEAESQTNNDNKTSILFVRESSKQYSYYLRKDYEQSYKDNLQGHGTIKYNDYKFVFDITDTITNLEILEERLS